MSGAAIIGAGIGGLTLALALARGGRQVTVYEQAAELADVGAGITLSPNATLVLAHLGLGPALAAIGYAPSRQLVQDWRDGHILREFSRGADAVARYGAPYLHVHRADLHHLLAGALLALQPHAVQTGRRAVLVMPEGAIVFADGGQEQAELVVGADGLKSTVRDALSGADRPHFTGQVAWRGIVPANRLPDGFAAATPGIHIGPGRMFMRYPVRGATLLNYAAFVELEGWTEESWLIPSTREELLGHFAGWDPMLHTIIAATPEGELHKWALHARDPLARWVYGRVTLLGDAAHAMLPFLGQGAATSIEDAMVLARCLEAFAREEALQRYEAARLPRTTLVQAAARRLGLAYQGRDPGGPVRNEEELGLFGYDAVTCPI